MLDTAKTNSTNIVNKLLYRKRERVIEVQASHLVRIAAQI